MEVKSVKLEAKNNSVKVKVELKERAYLYALRIIKLLDSLPRSDWSAEVIAKQLLRSATSVGANIVEAQAGRTRKDFANFFSHALKSANESKFWLGLLRDSGKANKAQVTDLLGETKELANILGASILTLRGRR